MKIPKTSVIIVAGGTGSRMANAVPKQFLLLLGKPVICHSLDVFLSMKEVSEIIIVCHPEYRSVFDSYRSIRFAAPGKRRQDSVYNGFAAISPETKLVAIHDASRPLITGEMVLRVLAAANEHGAAVAAIPVSFTVKQGDDGLFVERTIDRSHLWEIQTPQIARIDLLKAGFDYANEHNLTVTDDVALVELIHHPVKLVEGRSTNRKITYPEDLKIAEELYASL